MTNALDTNPNITWFQQNPGCLPNEIHDLEMEALTTYPFTSIINQCPPDRQTGLIDANRVSKFWEKDESYESTNSKPQHPLKNRPWKRKNIRNIQNIGERERSLNPRVEFSKPKLKISITITKASKLRSFGASKFLSKAVVS